MAQSQCSSNTRMCVTCAFWDGKRTPNIKFVLYSPGTVGKCYKIFVNGVERLCTMNCTSWEKWNAIR